jgi:hypothetical protein
MHCRLREFGQKNIVLIKIPQHKMTVSIVFRNNLYLFWKKLQLNFNHKTIYDRLVRLTIHSEENKQNIITITTKAEKD